MKAQYLTPSSWSRLFACLTGPHRLVARVRVAEIEKRIEARFRDHQKAEILLSMPGFGTLLASEFLAATGGDVTAYDSPAPGRRRRPRTRPPRLRPHQRQLSQTQTLRPPPPQRLLSSSTIRRPLLPPKPHLLPTQTQRRQEPQTSNPLPRQTAPQRPLGHAARQHSIPPTAHVGPVRTRAD